MMKRTAKTGLTPQREMSNQPSRRPGGRDQSRLVAVTVALPPLGGERDRDMFPLGLQMAADFVDDRVGRRQL
jgi:hypothetical protein